MNYEIRHYDTPLLRFSATEDTARPEIEILWVNDDAETTYLTEKERELVEYYRTLPNEKVDLLITIAKTLNA